MAPAAQPLQLLGDVGQLKLDRAGADVRLERAAPLGMDERGQRPDGPDITTTHPRGRVAQPEHPIAERATLLLLEHITKQPLEYRGVSIEGVTHRAAAPQEDQPAVSCTATQPGRLKAPRVTQANQSGSPASREKLAIPSNRGRQTKGLQLAGPS